MNENIVLAVTLIGVLGVGAQWLAWRFNLPAIVLMAAVGLLVGPGLGILSPEETFGDFFEPIIQIAVAIILFEGGLQLKFSELKGVGHGIGRLVLLGAPIAWVLGALAGHFVAGLSWPTAIIFGGIMIVTGPTVIMPLLRQARLSSRPAALLKWEGIINDPFGALAAVIVFEYILGQANSEFGTVSVFLSLLISSVICVGWGIFMGWGLAKAFRRGWVPEYLKSPVLLSAVMVAFVIANFLQEEGGLLAVTAMGITMANAKMPSINQLRHFKENIATLFIAGVFVILTANLSPEILAQMNWRMVAFVVVMLVVVRPISVLLSTWGTDLSFNERILVGWIAPRGIVAVAVSGLFAVSMTTQPGFPADGALMVPLAFAMVFATVILHGFTIAPFSKMLGLASTLPPGVLIVGASPWSIALAERLMDFKVPVLIADPDYRASSAARQAGIETHYGEILSELTEHHVDFSRFGFLLALSGNEAHNALVCTDLGQEIGRVKTFQLSSYSAGDSRKNVSYTLQGQPLLGGKASLDDLLQRHWAGWTFQITKLSEEYPPEAYLEAITEDAMIVMIRRKGVLMFSGSNNSFELQIGDRVLAFVPKEVSDTKIADKLAEEKKETVDPASTDDPASA